MKKYYLLFVLASFISGNYLMAQKQTSNCPPADSKAAEVNNNQPANGAKTVQVQLLFFKADISNDVGKLHWVTEDEHALKSFTIERSTNNRDFYPLAIMPAMNEDGQLFYKYADSAISKLSAQAVYYRLKIAGETDHYSYSPVVNLAAGSGAATASNYANTGKTTIRLK